MPAAAAAATSADSDDSACLAGSSSTPAGSSSSGAMAASMLVSGHSSHIVDMAKACRENEWLTDVNVVCSDGVTRAHRLVLASCSPFLSSVFLSLPDGLPDFTLIVPDIKKEVVNSFIEFLYTGKMILEKTNTEDLRQLVHSLQIDPDNVKVLSTESSSDEDEDSGVGDTSYSESRASAPGTSSGKLVQSKITQMIGARSPATRRVSPAPPAAVSQPAQGTDEVMKKHPNPLLRGLKRRASANSEENQSGVTTRNPLLTAKQQKLSLSPAGPLTVITPNLSSPHRLRESSPGSFGVKADKSAAGLPYKTTKILPGSNLRSAAAATAGGAASPATRTSTSGNSLLRIGGQGRATPAGRGELGVSLRAGGGAKRGGGRLRSRGGSSGGGASSSSSSTPTGFHDMGNVETWVCAICKQYDPVLPTDMEPSKMPTTEWVGCDCNRWYHQYCTKLEAVDDTFSCALVNIMCLPME